MQNKLWFKAKNYGWGWYPSSWQGWLILIIYTGYIIYRSKLLKSTTDTSLSFVIRYCLELLLPTMILIILCFRTGEKPEWRWGKKTTKK